MVFAIGNSPASPAAIWPGMSLTERMIASRKTTPTAPEIQIDDRTPLGACRPGVHRLLAERASGVEAVHDEDRHEEADREGRQEVAVLRLLGAHRLEQDIGRLVIREEEQDQREDEHAQDLGRHADVVEDRQEPDAERVDGGRQDQRDDRR